MKRLAVAVIVGIFVTGAFAQTAAPKPGPEQKRIGYFAGKWNWEGESKPSPMGPGGKVTGTENCSWYEGGFHLVCHNDFTGPRGKAKGQSIMGYDPTAGTYTYYAINSIGEGFFVRGNVTDAVWTWDAEMPVEGKSMKMKVTITEQSPTVYVFKVEGSFDGGPWTVFEEAKATKAS